MQAVILAAGESSRFWPLNQKHKSLCKIMGKPLICYTLENLKKTGVKEIIIVQSQKRGIENELRYYQLPSHLRIKYVLQKKPLGTGDALKAAKNYLKERFLVLYGDDFYGSEAIEKCLLKFPTLLVKKVANTSAFGVIIPEKNYVKEIIEKPEKSLSNLVNIGCYFIPGTILAEKIEKSPRGEYELTDYIKKLTQKTKIYFLKAKNWIPFSFVWDLLNINEHLLSGIKTKIKGKVEKNCHLQSQIIIEQGTAVKSGTYIEGPVYIGKNCQIGPNCYLRPFTLIEDNCRIGQAVEIKNSIIGQGSRIAHLSYVGDSIIGENCILGAGTILANLRFDQKNVHSVVKGKLTDTQRQKFGAVLGNRTKIGVNVSIMPGILIGSNCQIGPHSLVMENIEDNKIFYTKHQKVVQDK